MPKRHRIHKALKNFAVLGMTVVIACLVVACDAIPHSPTPTLPASPFRQTLRLFWVNSYNADDLSFQKLQASALATLSEAGYSVDAGTLEMDVFHLDAARFLALSNMEPIADVAIARIQAFNPEVVLVSGDAAALSVIPRYPDLNQPFVFCDVVGDPNVPGLRRPAVTGVLANPHPMRTIAMAQAFLSETSEGESTAPETTDALDRFLILSDPSIAGQGVLASIYEILREIEKESGLEPTVQIVTDWTEWQATAASASETYDFILLLGHKSVRDVDGTPVPSEEVMAWMVENVSIPIFSLFNEAVVNGAVGGLVTSEEDQGEAVAQMVVRIARGAHPSSISERLSSRNLLAINLAAARRWSLSIPIAFPLAGRVYRELPSAETIAPESGQMLDGDTWYNSGYNTGGDPGMLTEHKSWMLRGGP